MNKIELNNAQKDSLYETGNVKKNSPVVEVFSAMIDGKEMPKTMDAKRADKAVEYIKAMSERASNGDMTAMAELNSIRREVLEQPVLQEMKLLSIFGSYKACGSDETIEREVWKQVGDMSRRQAANGDVPYSSMVKEHYTVPTFTVSAGWESDYRRMAIGDMSKENEAKANVLTSLKNNAVREIMIRVYDAIKNANGVKFNLETAGLTKTGVDKILNEIRRYGKPTVVGDYALLTQFTPWAGYVGKIDTNTITGVSEKVMNELMSNGLLGQYNGSVLAEIANPYNEFEVKTDEEGNKYFDTLMPMGLGFILPTGVKSPIATYTRGGLTSMTGNSVATGRILTRWDIEVGCDVAKGQEHRIGTMYDTNLGGLDE